MKVPDWLADYSECLYLLARFNPPQSTGWQGGREWERAAARALQTPVRQGPGSLKLFGRGSASGLAHEVDGAGAGRGWTLIHEAKAYSQRSPSKEELFTFDRKTFDLYVERRRFGEEGEHWRSLILAGPLDDGVRRYCYLYGIVAVDAELIPLPMLLRMAGRPNADLYFSDQVLGELVRLGEEACAPMEARYIPESRDRIYLNIRKLMTNSQLDDLLWLQRDVTADLLELVDREQPGYFEDRATDITSRFGLSLVARSKQTAA